MRDVDGYVSLHPHTPSSLDFNGISLPGSGAAVRLYFHLADSHDTLPDQDGIEVSDLRQVRAEVLQVLDELRQEDASAARDWSGWRLTVTDAAGAVVFALDLDRALS